MGPQDALQAYADQINLHQFDALVPLLADDAVFWFSDGSHVGIDAIRTAFERTWRQIQDEVYWLEDVRWIALGDRAASCIYRFHWKGIYDGQSASGSGRGTTVLHKQGNQWKIAHEHLSRSPA